MLVLAHATLLFIKDSRCWLRTANTLTYVPPLTDMLERDHMSTKHGVISRAKCDLAALARGAALVIDLYFFNGVPFSFEARLTSTVRRENINYSTTTPPPVLVVSKRYI